MLETRSSQCVQCDNRKIGRFVEYEPCVHELLSPRLHGIANSGGTLTITERTMSNQPYFCCRSSEFSADTVRKQWMRNLCQVDEFAAVRPAKVSKLIQRRSDTEERLACYQRALDFYQRWENPKTSRHAAVSRLFRIAWALIWMAGGHLLRSGCREQTQHLHSKIKMRCFCTLIDGPTSGHVPFCC